jgi:hypothetical protein
MTKALSNQVEFITFRCKETRIPNPYYNDCIIGKNTINGNPFNQGDPLAISVDSAKNILTPEMMNVPCLANLGVHFYYGYGSNQLSLTFDDVKFDCDENLQTPKPLKMSAFDKICYCADNMRNGKCPYQIAKKLFPNAYKGNQR